MRKSFGIAAPRIPQLRVTCKRFRLSKNDIREIPRKALRDWLNRLYHAEYSAVYTKTPKWKVISANNISKRRAAMQDTDIDTDFLLDLWDKTTSCSICHEPLGLDRHLDHIIPLIIGGKHRKDNVRYVHARCNCKRPKDGSDLHYE